MNNSDGKKIHISVLKKVLFFLNASSQKLICDIDTKQNLTDAQARLGAFIVIYAFEFGCIRFIDSHIIHLSVAVFKIVLVLPAFFHGLINLFFAKNLNEIVTNYYMFYSKTLLYIFYILLVFGVAYLGLSYL